MPLYVLYARPLDMLPTHKHSKMLLAEASRTHTASVIVAAVDWADLHKTYCQWVQLWHKQKAEALFLRQLLHCPSGRLHHLLIASATSYLLHTVLSHVTLSFLAPCLLTRPTPLKHQSGQLSEQGSCAAMHPRGAPLRPVTAHYPPVPKVSAKSFLT